MATNFLVHEKIWFDKFKYDDAERKFYEQMNGPVAAGSRQVSTVLRAGRTAWARDLLLGPRGPVEEIFRKTLAESWGASALGL